MKTVVIFFACFLSIVVAYAVTPFQWSDGRIEFAKYMVGDKPVFSDAERDYVLTISGYEDAIVAPLTPTVFEVAVSTSGLKFSSHEDFRKTIDEKEHLDDKILDLKPSEAKAIQTQTDSLKAAIATK